MEPARKTVIVDDRRRWARRVALLVVVTTVGAWSTFAVAKSDARTPTVDKRAGPAANADPRVSLVLARALAASEDPAGAAQIFRQLVARGDATPDLKLEFADTLIAAALYDEAIGVLTNLAPGSKLESAAQLGLARIQLKLNQPATALPFAEHGALLDPRSVGLQIACGVALDRVGRHPEAQVHYRAALSVAPRSIAARSDLALSLALSRNYAEAIDILLPIARSANATPADRQNLAFVYGMKGDSAAALALGAVDLDAATAQSNARFFAFAARAIE